MLRGRSRKTEELEVGRNLLEEHVRSHIKAAAAGLDGFQARRHFLLHHHFANKRLGCYARDIHRHRVIVVYAQRRGIDDQAGAGGIVGADADVDMRIMHLQARANRKSWRTLQNATALRLPSGARPGACSVNSTTRESFTPNTASESRY